VAGEPIRAGAVPNGSLNGMKPSEKAVVPERAWAKRSGGCRASGLSSTKYTHLLASTHTPCISRGSGWRIHCGVEVTESSTNKQQTHTPHTPLVVSIASTWLVGRAECVH
jgi:hypothetical protein